jgi:hypothetical protein
MEMLGWISAEPRSGATQSSRYNLLGMGLVVLAATWLVARLDPDRGVNRALGATVTTDDPAKAHPTELTDGELQNGAIVTSTQGEPSVQLDLGKQSVVSRLVVYNRLGSGLEQGSPLLVELSQNGKDYVRVARQDATFSIWNESFEPQPARYVRVKLLRKVPLILREIEVY